MVVLDAVVIRNEAIDILCRALRGVSFALKLVRVVENVPSLREVETLVEEGANIPLPEPAALDTLRHIGERARMWRVRARKVCGWP